MSGDVWVAVSSIVGVAALLISFLAYRERHSDRGDDRIREIVRNELSAIVVKHTELATKLDGVVSTQQQLTDDLHEYSGKISIALDRVTVLETKIEVFWKSVAMDAARIIHSPDPRRAHIDALLESFMNGTLTPGQAEELRKSLAVIRDYEPGVSDLDFPVYPGEQIAAAILLRTMEHAITRGGSNDRTARGS